MDAGCGGLRLGAHAFRDGSGGDLDCRLFYLAKGHLVGMLAESSLLVLGRMDKHFLFPGGSCITCLTGLVGLVDLKVTGNYLKLIYFF